MSRGLGTIQQTLLKKAERLLSRIGYVKQPDDAWRRAKKNTKANKTYNAVSDLLGGRKKKDSKI